ncbi:2-oxoglutarate and iron-dependent oxygenase domain-containing protein [Tsuneonella sp. CC-YZS046]|uniref:isopenicillin N synthase family dioxygenase n=1 Tax=Tsuneonella sp. CC-YZS046 TaxID=3042152 RepID=UPI002D780029|nr:2-oxoglutarate and iron-dependent oxygenase domain-containing protein [Tsuneonella sp. CC-YZS046]WRO67472.1 2-oxoglutarate and iron-dependent oxygenase domain-containing protein [Tsuneonella sp. CC-YZS046]
MDSPALPVLSLADPAGAFAEAIGRSFRQFGFALVRDHGLDRDLVARAWALTKAFFALPDAEKRRYHVPGIAGARGYTPFGTEIAKGATRHDLKEFWHVGRDLPAGHPLESVMPANIWPLSPEGFEQTLGALFSEMDRVGGLLLSRIALHLKLAEDWFRPATKDGNSILRLLHYPPVEDDAQGAIRAEAHEDINLITLLLGAEESGLQLLDRNGAWIDVAPPEGTLVVNIGDMLQRLTNHVLPSTTHRVRNPSGPAAGRSRYAMPFFLHLRSDFLIRTLPQCIGSGNPDRYPEPITADAYLQQRLREIGLAKP